MKRGAKPWISQAEADLDSVSDNIKTGHYDVSMLYCQQAAEKALKAVLLIKTGAYPKIHDLVSLARRCGAPNEVIDACMIISPYYTTSRYPDIGGPIPAKAYSEEEAKRILNNSEKVVAWSKKMIA